MQISVELWWNDSDSGKKEVLGEKLVSMPLFALEISHKISWYRSSASSVTGRRLTSNGTVRIDANRKPSA